MEQLRQQMSIFFGGLDLTSLTVMTKTKGYLTAGIVSGSFVVPNSNIKSSRNDIIYKIECFIKTGMHGKIC